MSTETQKVASHHESLMVSWAAPVITASGAALHPVTGGWDVEMPDGSWRAANSAVDLCAVAHEVRHG